MAGFAEDILAQLRAANPDTAALQSLIGAPVGGQPVEQVGLAQTRLQTSRSTDMTSLELSDTPPDAGSIDEKSRGSKARGDSQCSQADPSVHDADQIAHVSPDPLYHTDRYRLMTPYKLRL